jgi:tetratricopeptide (TPR) repeat protein
LRTRIHSPSCWSILLVASFCVLPALVGCGTSSQGRNVDGVRHYQMGRYHEAIQDFQKALVANPSDADAYYNLGATYHALGKLNRDRNLLSQSEGLYHQCLDLNAEHTACYRGLAALLVETDRSESAFTLLKRWASRNNYSADARIELARLYEEFGDKETASQYLAEALQLNSYNSRAWSALGRIREQQGQVAQALANYQQAYQLNQFQPGVADRIATLQRSLPGVASSTPPPQIVNVPGSVINR